MPKERMKATLDTTVILGAVGNPLGPNAGVIAQGLVGIYPMVLAQSVIAEALRHLRRGFGKVPPLSDGQIETVFATLFQHWWEPQILRPAPPTTLNTTAVQHELLGRWLVKEGYITSGSARRVNPHTRVGEVSPKDLHVLAVALESGSQFIVTSNGQDYPDHCGVAVVPPSQFLMHLASD